MRKRSDRDLTGRAVAQKVFNAGLKAVDPCAALAAYFKASPIDLTRYKNIFVIGGGKAACRMALAVERLYGKYITGGAVVTKYGHSLALKKISVLEAGHPVPDRSGVAGTKKILSIAGSAAKEDLVVTLLSGGASALLASPRGVTLEEKRRITKLLVNSGASIGEINAVRKHLSNVKGGRLVEMIRPACSLTLIVSDVVGNDISTIGSGPTVPDPTTYADALSVLKRYGIVSKAPGGVLKMLKAGCAKSAPETPKPGDGRFKKAVSVIVADNLTALEAAKRKAASLGYNALILSSTVTGSTASAAAFFSAIISEVKRSGNPAPAPACLLMGGETTLKVIGRGLGGRNQEFALLTAKHIETVDGVTVLCAGTDGTDGPTDAAGAFVDSATLRRAAKAGIDYLRHLRENDSYNFFKTAGGLFVTGPTGTNVMDMAVAVIE